MKPILSPLTSGTLLLLTLGLSSFVHAELPELTGKEWLGSFSGKKDNNIRFTISTTGELVIQPIYKGEARAYVKMPITCGLEVTSPNGRKQVLEILPESLESPDKPTNDFEATTFRGSFEGGAEVEFLVELKRSVVSVGGRITKPGTHDPEFLRVHVSALVLNFYGRKSIELKNDPKAFEALVADDYAKLKWSNGKQHKFDFITPRDMTSKEVNGPGATEAEISIKAIDREFQFEAAGDSIITMSNRRNSALHRGMNVNWTPIAGKDPKATSRLIIAIK